MRTAHVLAGLAMVLAAATLMAASAGQPVTPKPAPTKEIPQPSVEFLDDAFKEVAAPGAEVKAIGQDFQFTEGPTWMPEGFLVFSDIPADTLYRWDEKGGLAEFRKPSRNANGNTVDPEGRLVTAEHGSRSVTRTGKDGKVETLAATHQGKRLNSPNDVVVKRDGSVWFTDPPYGIKPDQVEQPGNYVYRLSPGAKEPVPVIKDLTRPNGLAFSPDEKYLYVAISDGKAPEIRRYPVQADNTLGPPTVAATIKPGAPDGIRVDKAGRIFSSAGDGVQVFSPEGKLLGKFRTPQGATNCCLGGPDGKTLFITARPGVYTVRLK